MLQIGAGRDGYLLLCTGGFVLRGHVHDAIGVDIEGDFNLRQTARRGRDTFQPEATQAHVVRRHGALALQHVDIDGCLAIRGCGKNLRLIHRYGGVALYERGHHLAESLNPERQRGHIQQQHVFYFAAEYAALNGRADRNHLVRVHAFVG